MDQPDRFTAILKLAHRQVRGLFLLSLLSNLLLLTSSIYMLQVFDRVLGSGSVDTLIWLTVMAMLAVATYGLLEHARRKVLMRTGAWLAAEVSPDVIGAAVRLRQDTGQSPVGLRDVQDIRGFLGGDAMLACLDAPWTPVFVALIWLMHPLLGMIALAGVIALLLIGVLTELLARPSLADAPDPQAQLRRDAACIVAQAGPVRAMGMGGALIAGWTQRMIAAEGAGNRAGETAAALHDIARVVRLAVQIVLVAAGATLVLGAGLTPGGMIAASIIFARAMSPVERMTSGWRTFVRYHAARRRLTRHLGTATAAVRVPGRAAAGARLEVAEVSYLAPSARQVLLASLNMTIAPGQHCGVIGPAGSGKSLLCDLMAGARPATVGKVRLDGVAICDLDDADRGAAVGYLPQTLHLFDGTVAQNIARMGQVDFAKVSAAAAQAGAEEMILRLPRGLDTMLRSDDIHLSPGEIQLIGLARALYGDPGLVVLDAPETHLDGAAEIALQQTIATLKSEGRTVVVASHAPHLLQGMDILARLQGGRLIACGPRTEVLRGMQDERQALSREAMSHAAE